MLAFLYLRVPLALADRQSVLKHRSTLDYAERAVDIEAGKTIAPSLFFEVNGHSLFVLLEGPETGRLIGVSAECVGCRFGSS